MASLVTALAADHAAAASGTAEFYSMGTAQLSSLVYSDANGITAVTSTTLDAHGSAVRYVGEPVDVVIKNVTGATVMSFTHIDDARVVRLESSAFTGPNTNGNGQVVAGGRTTEAAAWALFGASVGTANATVTVNGTTYTIVNAIGQTSRVFNVRSYGADNTGAQDAGTAITAAMTAAVAAGGGWIYFPAGTYRISSTIQISSALLQFAGDGEGVSIIKSYIASASAAINNAGFTGACSLIIQGLTFTHNTTSTVYAVQLADAYHAVVRDCEFTNHATAVVVSSAGSNWQHVTVERCRGTAGATSPGAAGVFGAAGSAKGVTFRSCRAYGGATSGNETGFMTASTASYVRFMDCYAEAMTRGTGNGFQFSNGTSNITAVACTGSGNDTDLTVGSTASAVSQYGNMFATITDLSTTGEAFRRVNTQTTSSALVTFTVTPAFATYATTATFHQNVISTYTVGAATATIAIPSGLANLPIGTIVEFTFIKVGANLLNLTWNAAYLSPNESSAFGGMATVASAFQSSVRFRVISTTQLACCGVGASVAI